MMTPFMDAYVKLLIKTCHKRGVHAMGGMSAQIPIKDNASANKIAMEKVVADKEREVKAGHDGTWVAHPALVDLAKQVFNKYMPQPNQLFVRRDDVNVKASDLLSTNGIKGKITENGVRLNINVSLQYVESWLRGVGCVPIHHLMEDAATAEISRTQIWQWAKHQAKTEEGSVITPQYVSSILNEETQSLKNSLPANQAKSHKFDLAKKLLESTLMGSDYAEFLTTLAYKDITVGNSAAKF